MAERDVVFAGGLEFGDYWSLSEGSVVIDRKERDLLASRVASLPAGLRASLTEVLEKLPSGVTIASSAGQRYGATSRSQRPCAILDVMWAAAFTGLGIEDIATRMAPAVAAKADEAGLPAGCGLEVWCLPVVDATFQFLITPAGEWPPGPGDG